MFRTQKPQHTIVNNWHVLDIKSQDIFFPLFSWVNPKYLKNPVFLKTETATSYNMIANSNFRNDILMISKKNVLEWSEYPITN